MLVDSNDQGALQQAAVTTNMTAEVQTISLLDMDEMDRSGPGNIANVNAEVTLDELWIRAINATAAGKKALEVLNSPKGANTSGKPVQATGHLFFGALSAPLERKARFEKYGITRVFNCSSSSFMNAELEAAGFEVMSLPNPNAGCGAGSDLLCAENFRCFFEYVEEAKAKGQKVFAGCQTGMNRSALFTIAYVIEAKKLKVLRAISEISQRSGPIICLPEYQQAIYEFARVRDMLDSPSMLETANEEMVLKDQDKFEQFQWQFALPPEGMDNSAETVLISNMEPTAATHVHFNFEEIPDMNVFFSQPRPQLQQGKQLIQQSKHVPIGKIQTLRKQPQSTLGRNRIAGKTALTATPYNLELI